MADKISLSFTSRNAIPFSTVPTMKLSRSGGTTQRYSVQDYADILDSVYEMTDAVATGNGVPIADAMAQVLKDTGWAILPIHRKELERRLLL